MSVNTGKVRSQQGFSIAEVMIAITLFIASVLGVSLMLISGGANITVGAKESAAANLAAKKIEEVKSLPFYLPWDGAPKDIDDYYWAYNGSTPRANSEQFANPVVENYGTIPGYAAYRRSTAVCYQYVPGSSLANATMDPTWVPKAPGTSQTDRPTGGAAAGPYRALHAVLIQVKVFYQTDNGEKSYTAQGLAGDLMITGGTNNPMMVINSIQPSHGFYGTASMEMKIYVSTPPNTLGASSQLAAYLWYPGHSDIYALNSPAPPRSNAAGTEITCYFNLGTASVRPGYYNIAVYWKERGWLAVFRDNVFEVRSLPPTVTGVSNHNWGYSKQTARQMTLTGTELFNPTVNLKGPHPSNTYTIPGAVQSANGTTCVVNFNLTGTTAERPANSRWNLEVTTPGGTVNTNGDSTNSRRLWLNPPPTITQVSPTAPGSYYDWAYLAQTTRRVRVEGTYLYGMNEADTSNTLLFEPYETARAAFVSGATGNACVSDTALVMDYNPNSSSAPVNDTTRNSRWKVKITNYGGTVQSTAANSQRVWMNPPPRVDSISNWSTNFTGTGPGGSNTGKTLSVSITGDYLQNSPSVYIAQTGGVVPYPPSCVYQTLTGGTVANDGRSITGMSANITVNPMSFVNVNGNPVTNADLAPLGVTPDRYGNFYIVLYNADGQTHLAAGPLRALTHKQYTYTISSDHPNWLTVSGGGTKWQDENVTLTASPVAGYAGTGVTFGTPSSTFGWLEWNGSSWVNASASMTWASGGASANKTYKARAWKKLYWGPDGASANYAAFQAGTARGNGSLTMNYAGAYGTCMRAYAGKTGNDERTWVTGSMVEMTDAISLKIYWEHVNDDDPQGSSFNVSTVNGGEGDTTGGTRIWKGNDFSITTDTIGVSTYDGTRFVRFHARAWNDFWSGDGASDTRAYRIWLE